jgi:hypothetical protein
MNDPSQFPFSARRRRDIDAAHRQMQARRQWSGEAPFRGVPGETWIFVWVAISGDMVSRAFAWVRIVGYSLFILAIIAVASGVAQFRDEKIFFDVCFGVVLVRNIWLLLSQEAAT